MDTLKQMKVALVMAGTDETPEETRLAETSERCNLNRLCGMEPRNKYPAFRDDLTIESVREATLLLMQAERAADAGAKRALRYRAERVIYPRQSKQAYCEGASLLAKVFNAP